MDIALSDCAGIQPAFRDRPGTKATVEHMDEFRARRITPQQKALLAELRAADYPATWKLSAGAADDKLVASRTQIQTRVGPL
jgi:hypothetical protein